MVNLYFQKHVSLGLGFVFPGLQCAKDEDRNKLLYDLFGKKPQVFSTMLKSQLFINIDDLF